MELNLQNFVNQTKTQNQNNVVWNLPVINNTANQAPLNSAPLSNNVKDEFVKFKKKRNGIEKLTDGIRNLTHLGFGSKKAENVIQNSNEEDAKKAFDKYKACQESAAQTIGDAASAAAGLGAFYGIMKGGKYINSLVKLDAIPTFIEEEINAIPKDIGKKIFEKVKNITSSKGKTIAVGAAAAMLLGGIVKKTLLKPNVKEHKLDKEQKKTLSRAEKKQAKKALRKAKRKENRKNFLTGALNGVAAPLLSLAGIVGAPIYAAGSFLLRHKTAQNDSGTIVDDLKNNAVISTLGAVGISALMIKKGKNFKAFEANMDKVVKKLKDVKLKSPDFDTSKTTYAELEEILMSDEKINRIINSGKTCEISRDAAEEAKTVEEQIQALTKENIFAVKFKQIQNSSDPLTMGLRENCPPSRTLEEAQKAIDGLSKAGKYQVKKLLGVGTIAETYLATDASGKEVCVKILKNGISKEKILADKAKFAELITKGAAPETLSEKQKYLLRNLDDLSEGILKEVDFKNEMEAAKKLAQYTKKANVVVPISAEDGIYVMERANGISLDSLSKYYEYEGKKKSAQSFLEAAKNTANSEDCFIEQKIWEDKIKEMDEKIRKLKERTPDFEHFDLSNKEVKKLLSDYMEVYTEQFEKIERGGKTLHADIHPGNIFVDINALKSGKGKALTLIDTGNTVNLSAEQSIRALELTNYIHKGNVNGITKYVLDGAKLPEGMDSKRAHELVEGEFKKLFFDSNTKLENVTNDSLLTMANGIMRKHDIIPNDAQLNLNKAKQSANNSFNSFFRSFVDKKYSNMDDASDKIVAANALGDLTSIFARKGAISKIQQIKNLFQNSPKEIIKSFFDKNPNNAAQEEYLTYKMKQAMNKTSPLMEKLENL